MRLLCEVLEAHPVASHEVAATIPWPPARRDRFQHRLGDGHRVHASARIKARGTSRLC